MSNRPAQAALVAALSDWRRHAVAGVLVAMAIGVAFVIGSQVVYYGAALFAFVIWMAWFVLTTIEWLRRADF